MPRRILALWLPHLPLDRLRRREPALRGVPLATWSTAGNRRLLTAAEGPGLFAGQALADAQAICPGLALRPADPEADAALLERLAVWSLRWTPLAAVDGPDGLLLDVTGGTTLFGGEAALLRQVRASLQRAGFAVRAALAGTAEAAAALARAADGAIVPPGQDLAAVSPLPLSVLRLSPDLLSGLSRLGLRSIADLLRQPRAPLARRFGRVLLDALDGVSGARRRPVQPLRPPAEFLAVRDCLEPILTRPAIEHVLEALLTELCRQLLQAGRGARRLTLCAWRVDGQLQEVAIGTGAASRDLLHLRRLFAEPLGTLEPDLGFERLTLAAPVTEPLEGLQAVLRGERVDADPDPDEADLAALIDRLAQRLAVHRLRPLESHWPEYAAVPADPFETVAVPLDWGAELRPVRLLATPIPLAVTAAVPDGPPAQLRYGGVAHRVLSVLGPERLEPEWWGEDAARPARDYYRVQTVEGPRLWICRLLEPGRPPRWFLHGELA
ncbi:Y-family DNA polymerase [Roseomonas marmotae]|uniref:DNA polymerase Y family protein n=1 Tax=Roseomonas marmotae TaxID=2768161 RepID=A0ABS3KIL5_9PROT|nr:DNA polymerase Y family protein [Roseomonas marmotae]MBO1077311.1 DNA polymerase Y family protein [Roseomonas marmotae]QTI82055.1 DNA polymerase Y family protein [Roseomonas marmotae]